MKIYKIFLKNQVCFQGLVKKNYNENYLNMMFYKIQETLFSGREIYCLY